MRIVIEIEKSKKERVFRTFKANPKAKWLNMTDIPKCAQLCDNGPSMFWDIHVQTLSENMPLYYEGDQHITARSGFYLSKQNLLPTGFVVNPKPMCFADSMEYAVSDKKSKTKEIKPRKKLKKLWEGWFSKSVIVYNKSLEYLRTHPAKTTKLNLRNIIKNEFAKKFLPNTILEYSVFEAYAAFKSSKEAKDRDPLQSYPMSVDSRNIKDGYIYKSIISKEMKRLYPNKHQQIFTKLRLPIDEFMNAGVIKLIHDPILHRYYLTRTIDVIPKVIPEKKQFVSLDPGIRTFMTYYDGESFGEIGKDFDKKLDKICTKLNDLNAKMNATTSKQKIRRYSRASAKIYKKMKNKIKDLHYKTIKFLSNYQTVIIPSFKVSKMAGGLNRTVNRRMYSLSHFLFKVRLVNKTSENGNNILICDESFTSKTCTRCGTIYEDLKDQKVFHCNNCHITHDRDYNGARNIALRVFSYGDTFLANNSVGMLPPS